jgi:hypothetical protein
MQNDQNLAKYKIVDVTINIKNSTITLMGTAEGN